MKKREKLSSLTENFDKELYYDREELITRYSYEEGYKKRNFEIAIVRRNRFIKVILV